MDKKIKVHPAQVEILKVLLFRPEARFAELNTLGLATDHLTFHIKSLVKAGLVVKKENGVYVLTADGKEFANRFDMDSEKSELERQAKIGVLVCAVREENGEKQFLAQQRLKQPYFGFYGFITGKVKWGEVVSETAARELKEESGLSGNLTLRGIKHKMDYSEKGRLLEDKYFFVFKAERLKGKLIENFEGGKNIWLSRAEILNLPNLFDGVDESIEMVLSTKLIFSETKYKVKGY